ncbi:hypothetical protein DDB_G0289223 [Dictyostelium discoideum AX4]|uniref:Uncharacterized protein n=1 Tax=Dictyostelium discoideum TaxID=44689 RepID=Q54HU3_DICDI|nr:hypothetical protein DDB_G0289223 [Dictyostelium discoideum AX4]EAL62845.1 hypothetical protein DDB_G0289223 [Dictyostelium discoideum AX4]|eukprot:XP_636346.1 hypothetical protein DDB_G0289223 [Dictyostelium discoideum AX4]
MKSQPSQDDNIIPEPTLPPTPSIDDDSKCIYDSANPYSIDLQPTIGTNVKCPTNEKELHYDLSTYLTCTDNTIKTPLIQFHIQLMFALKQNKNMVLSII